VELLLNSISRCSGILMKKSSLQVKKPWAPSFYLFFFFLIAVRSRNKQLAQILQKYKITESKI